MIPKNISREDILKAISEIDKIGVPKSRLSRAHSVKYNECLYPPKYLLSLANKFANGEELAPYLFSGGHETNDYLENLGFEIVHIHSHEI